MSQMHAADDAFLVALLHDDPELLYDRAPCGYLSTTPDGVIVKTNHTLLTMLGFAGSDVVGRTLAEFLTPGGQIYHETHFAPMLRMGGAVREIALDLVRADGARTPVLINAVMERDGNGEPLVVRIAVFDATHRRSYERELVAAKNRAEEAEGRATALARTLQQTLIPPALPSIDGLEIAARYRPAGDGSVVGGDFYDIFQLGEGEWAVELGDVAGKGVGAAVVTALARYTLRAAAAQHRSPVASLRALNDMLRRDATHRFCTVVSLVLERAEHGWRGSICLGGHPRPVLRTGDGEVRPVGRYGTLLGAFPEATLYEESIRLASGDSLVLYTDGVTDARRGPDLYGDERLSGVLRGQHHSADSLADALLTDVIAFQSESTADDIAIVVLRATD